MDEVLKQFGMPMGPCELLDEIGLDVAAKVAHILHKDLGERSASSDAIDRILETSKDKDGKVTRLGRKGGLGLYFWDRAGGRRVAPDQQFVDEALFRGIKPKTPEHTSESLVRRMIYPMINEAAAILAEGLVASPAHVDLGMIFGTGFPPFRGGLLRYADSIGLDKVVAELERLSELHGPRLAPSPALRALAKDKGRFYT
jgi:3-hydroxyacyl-CoA dehydrogenase/enoyl-CoA hydratase/3-hydroxybutyryl-CoA epimerase